ncbi:MAG: GGDEF domain-containing protein [Firmicutes bacterium]|nr:GGDEF domain-containing protein [Bacillota bacterium]
MLDSVGKAALLMEKHGIGGLPVLNEGKLCGIITSRDVRRTHPNRIVADAMSKNVIHVSSNDSLLHAIRIIEEKKVERLPVMENCKLVGIVTKSDFLFEMGKHTDPLTGLKSGAYIRSMAENILSEGKEITIIFFDINDFGIINKNYGHVYGDNCLKIIGQVLSESTTNSLYFPGRYAGDEFIVVTAENKERAEEWAVQIMKRINESTKVLGIPVTFTAGIAGGRRSGNRADSHLSATVDDLINMASLASTKAKKEGRSISFAEKLKN